MGDIIWLHDTSRLRPWMKDSAIVMCSGRSAQHDPPEKVHVPWPDSHVCSGSMREEKSGASTSAATARSAASVACTANAAPFARSSAAAAGSLRKKSSKCSKAT